MTHDASTSEGGLGRWVVGGSAVLVLAVAAWNGLAGDWVDALYVVGLGVGGALLLEARRQGEEPVLSSTMRWIGIALLVVIVLAQLIGLVRYLLQI